MGGNCEQLEIDTKDICVLCLESTVNTVMDSPYSSQGLKHLLRYLKVSPKQLFNCSSEFLQSMEIREDINLKISLCSKCSSVTEKFNKLYQDYELIQLQFSDCVQSLHESIRTGNENPERVRKYKDQMRPTKSFDLVNASIAANLRNETLKKCSLRIQTQTPRVRVTTEKPNEGKCFKLPIQLPEPEVKGHATVNIALINNTDNEPEFCHDAENNKINVTQTERYLPRDNPTYVANPDFVRKPAPEAKPVDPNLNRTKNYFSISNRNKLKKSKLTTTTAIPPFPSSEVKGKPFIHSKIGCDYCGSKFSTRRSFNSHMAVTHTEHIISKFLPADFSLELSRQRIHTVWMQMIEVSGNECQFCNIRLTRHRDLKRHMMTTHAEQFAATVLENTEPLSLSKLTNAIIPTETNVDYTESNKGFYKSRFACEYCKNIYTSMMSLQNHRIRVHPEHIIYKYFPSHIPLDSCKQGVDDVLEQLCQQTSESGFKCKYCTTNIVQRTSFRLHLVSMHAEHIALEAQQCIGVTEQLEVVPPDPLACSSTWETRDCRDSRDYESNHNPSDGNQTYGPVEMDFDIGEEKFIKIENPPPHDVDLDPLDGDYLD